VLEGAGLTAQVVARATIESLVSRDEEPAHASAETTLGMPPTPDA
jgi:hypothetical protein